MSADLWQRGCERLAAELPEQQFNTWIRPLPVADVADTAGGGAVVTLRVPNRFKLDWIRNQYAGRIESLLSELAGKPVRLEIALAARDGHERPAANGTAALALASAPQSVGHVLNGTPRSAANVPAAPSAHNAANLAPGLSRNRLNLNLTFDNMVP